MDVLKINDDDDDDDDLEITIKRPDLSAFCPAGSYQHCDPI